MALYRLRREPRTRPAHCGRGFLAEYRRWCGHWRSRPRPRSRRRASPPRELPALVAQRPERPSIFISAVKRAGPAPTSQEVPHATRNSPASSSTKTLPSDSIRTAWRTLANSCDGGAPTLRDGESPRRRARETPPPARRSAGAARRSRRRRSSARLRRGSAGRARRSPRRGARARLAPRRATAGPAVWAWRSWDEISPGASGARKRSARSKHGGDPRRDLAPRHGRASPGHPTPSGRRCVAEEARNLANRLHGALAASTAWMTGTSPAMTGQGGAHDCGRPRACPTRRLGPWLGHGSAALLVRQPGASRRFRGVGAGSSFSRRSSPSTPSCGRSRR